MFIGRKEELEFLENLYQKPKGQLVVLYGRRRVGKTETLKQFCKNKEHIFYSCKQCPDSQQLHDFSKHMFKEDIPAKKYVSEFHDWESAFSSVQQLPYKGKKLLIIDEFPYMCRENASIPSVLQNLWDNQFKEENVMIILCGSAMSFIEKELLAEKNPLYGRATGIYKMNEMGFYDAIKFFPDYSDVDKVLAYAILGGIPHYLAQFQPQLSIEENIKKNILTKGCVLYSEVEFLLKQELRETAVYNTMIETVALGNTKLNDISQKSLLNNTAKTSVYLKNLIQLGIVKKEFSVDAKTKEKANKNRGTYYLTDNFFRFWYAFGYTNYSELESGDVEGIYEYVIRPNLMKFASITFEDICRQYIQKLQRYGRLPFRYAKMGMWQGKTSVRDNQSADGYVMAETEIDILAISNDGQNYLVGECKFKETPFSYSEYLDTRIKLKKEQEKANFYYALFSKSGFDEKIEKEDKKNTEIVLYQLSDIVSLEEE